MNFFADLHIHSCLSPCGDNDMTPGNILGMAVVKGLDMVAVTDHNAARNLPAAQKIADAYGLLLIPGMEITTREEVHMLGYFPSVETAVEFGDMLREHLPKKKNKPSFFGQQLILDEDDQVIGEEDALLIGATDFPLEAAAEKVREYGASPHQPGQQRAAGEPGLPAAEALFSHGGSMARSPLSPGSAGGKARASFLRRPLPGKHPGKRIPAAPAGKKRIRFPAVDRQQKIVFPS